MECPVVGCLVGTGERIEQLFLVCGKKKIIIFLEKKCNSDYWSSEKKFTMNKNMDTLWTIFAAMSAELSSYWGSLAQRLLVWAGPVVGRVWWSGREAWGG